MTRPSRDILLMATAYLWAQRSTCDRLSVGAVIHREGRILVQGYNGAPSGLPHCPLPHKVGRHTVTEHTPDMCRAVHAEQNAIAWAARHGVGLDGSELVVTHQPCLSCARSIINAGIVKVTYNEPYRLTDGLDLLNEASMLFVRLGVDREQMGLI